MNHFHKKKNLECNNAPKREGMIADLLLASIISTQQKLLIYFE